ncbi:mitochondrial escape protein 2 [Myotisia sp. PD_48]|nr:mitochondrial escape protein 2 [Myotisia sp. PD_48]
MIRTPLHPYSRRPWKRAPFPYPSRCSRTSGLGLCRHSTYTIPPEPEAAGHIETGPNEAIFWVDNVLPVYLSWIPHIPFLSPSISSLEKLKQLGKRRAIISEPLTTVERAFPPELRSRIIEVVPRLTDDGVFVKLSYDPAETPSDVLKRLQEHLEENPIQSWMRPFKKTRAALVRGRPWIEDLYHRFPSSRLKIEFLPVSSDSPALELTQEALYSFARSYGKLSDIIPQPADSKVVPRYALLDFSRPVSAIMAKNCLHGFRVSQEGNGKAGTVLQLSYERKLKANFIKNWVFNHPRIVIPVIAAILATITVIIFDPIRTFFIKTRIAVPLHLQDNKFWMWIQKQATKANSLFSFHADQRSDSGGLSAIWKDRQDDIQQIKNWLIEGNDTFIVVHGPRGSGKREFLLDEALKDYKNRLVIDCKPIEEARGDSATIAAAAAEVGYRPVFSWMNSISSVIDIATQSAIGTKAGLSETLDSQLGNIWQSTAKALKAIALEARKKDDKDCNLSDEEWLEANPGRRPVVIIDNFMFKSKDNAMVYDKLADWAAALVCSNIAHVIFLTSSISFSKTLSRALPNQVFHELSFSDCTPEVAKRFVLGQIEREKVDNGSSQFHFDEEYCKGLDSCIETLGGRLTDLEFLSRMIIRGETPNAAVQMIINQSAAEILKIFIIDVATGGGRLWTPEQAWYLIKELASDSPADNHTVSYSDVALSDLFKKDGEASINALEQAELISVTSKNGRPSIIRPGKPVLTAAFKKLVEDQVLSSRLDLRILSHLIAMENSSIDKVENELQILGSLPKQPREVGKRNFLPGIRSAENGSAYSLYAWGRRHVVLTTPSIAKHSFLQQETTPSPCIDYLMDHAFGSSKKMRRPEREGIPSIHNDQWMEPLTGDNFAPFMAMFAREIEQATPNLVTFNSSIVDQLHWERFAGIKVTHEEGGTRLCEANLYSLIRDFVGSITINLFMGKALLEVYPNVLPDLWAFNDRFNPILLGIPRWIPFPGLPTAYFARRRLLACLTVYNTAFAYLEGGRDPGIDWRDMDDVSEIIQARARARITQGYSVEFAASQDLSFIWAVNVRTSTLVFWNIVHILADSELHTQILKEITPHAKSQHFSGSGFSLPEPPRLSLSIDTLIQQCPLLVATQRETIRLYTSSFTYRKVTSDIKVGGDVSTDPNTYRLSAGDFVIIPHFLQNMNSKHFDSPDTFDSRRFLAEQSEQTSPIESTDTEKLEPGSEEELARGWDDPISHCWEFENRKMLAFIVSILALWDIQPADGKKWEIPNRGNSNIADEPKYDIRVIIRTKA